jgi:hypothetical protein
MTEETTEAVGPTSDAAVDAFAAWYRAAVEEDGDKVPLRLRASTPGSDAAIRSLIRMLCAIDAPDTPARHAAAEKLKDDPEWFGSAAFAASAILQTRTACGIPWWE